MLVDLWENFINKVMTKKYNKFFDNLYHFSRISYILEAREFYLKKGYKLTRSQKKEIKQYWNKYIHKINLNFHNFYTNQSGLFDVKYIPDDLYAEFIDKYFNNARIVNGYNDKNYFDVYLKDFLMPETYIRIINGQIQNKNYENLTKEQAIKSLLGKTFVVKPTVCTSEGNGVEIVYNAQLKDILKYMNDKNLIFQEKINQDKQLASLNKESVNTIRIMTLNLDGEIYTLNPVIRFGRNGSRVDNASAGGLFCGIKSDGTLTETAYEIHGEKHLDYLKRINYDNTPLTYINKVREIVQIAATKFAHFGLIGWDIAINEKQEPVIIEANLETCIPDMLQIANGPLFGDLTDRVLHKVFHNKEINKVGLDTNQYL